MFSTLDVILIRRWPIHVSSPHSRTHAVILFLYELLSWNKAYVKPVGLPPIEIDSFLLP